LKKDQQGLGRDEPYIGEEQVEELASRYRMEWRRASEWFSPRHQSCHRDLHSSKC
jgi:hypothetical protein